MVQFRQAQCQTKQEISKVHIGCLLMVIELEMVILELEIGSLMRMFEVCSLLQCVNLGSSWEYSAQFFMVMWPFLRLKARVGFEHRSTLAIISIYRVTLTGAQTVRVTELAEARD